MKNRKPPPNGPVLVLAPLKPVADAQPNRVEEERTFAAHYLRLADTVLRDRRSRKQQAQSGTGAAMDEVAKYDPLTFACVACSQEFSAADKMLDQLGNEVSEHISREHPEPHSRPQRQAA